MSNATATKEHRICLGDKYVTTDEMVALIGQAVRNALADHKAAGNPVAEWRDGRVVIVPPEDIDLSVFDEPSEPKSSEPETPKGV